MLRSTSAADGLTGPPSGSQALPEFTFAPCRQTLARRRSLWDRWPWQGPYSFTTYDTLACGIAAIGWSMPIL